MRIPKTHKAYAAVFAAALVIATGCSDPEARTGDSTGAASESGGAAPVSGSLADVCGAAQQEGELVSWNSEDPEAYEKIFAEFEKTYPGIKLSSVEVRPDDLVQKMVTEAAAGHPSGVDAISITMDKAGPLLDNHLINGDIDFTKMGVDANHIGDGNTVRAADHQHLRQDPRCRRQDRRCSQCCRA